MRTKTNTKPVRQIPYLCATVVLLFVSLLWVRLGVIRSGVARVSAVRTQPVAVDNRATQYVTTDSHFQFSSNSPRPVYTPDQIPQLSAVAKARLECRRFRRNCEDNLFLTDGPNPFTDFRHDEAVHTRQMQRAELRIEVPASILESRGLGVVTIDGSPQALVRLASKAVPVRIRSGERLDSLDYRIHIGADYTIYALADSMIDSKRAFVLSLLKPIEVDFSEIPPAILAADQLIRGKTQIAVRPRSVLEEW